MRKHLIAFTVAAVVALSLGFASKAMADVCILEFQGECLIWVSVP